MTLGSKWKAKAKSARTSFSLWPCHLDVSVDAEIEKNLALLSVAMALPMSV